jgi:pimeloyl-ACP methyl ester carboxylesterase
MTCEDAERMSTFVLVHGAWHGAWCWRDVTPVLEAEGHLVLTLDLPGHGEDSTPASEMTLQSYARCVQRSVETASEPVVLVGHSMGGLVVTQAAEYVPDQVSRLVYLTAFLPGDGDSLPSLAGSVAAGDNVQPHLVFDEQSGTCTVAEQARKDLFYGECGEDAAQFALANLGPESIAAIVAPVHVTPGGAGRVPRAYVECVLDNALTIALQRHMQTSHPCHPVLQLDADHSPFLSRPRELAAHLLSLAE